MAPISRKRKRVTISADSLPWSNATLPDQLDDAEGFYALEEVDDVEVVRDEAAGQTTFRVNEKSIAPSHESDAEEWMGFESSGDSEPGVQNLDYRRDKQIRNRVHKGRDEIDPQVNGFTALENVVDDEVDVSAWNSLGLSSSLLSSLAQSAFSSPTPIQKAAIPEILDGNDVVGKAATGSGKTIAYGIPIIERLLKDQGSFAKPYALIMSPTRELAHQLSRHLIDLCRGSTSDTLQPRIVTITGGLSLPKQQRLLADADIIVGTPGRLWEIISETPGTSKNLQRLQFLVLDEADRLLSEGHFQEMQEILGFLEKAIDEKEGKPWQTLVFSATFQKDLQQKLAKRVHYSVKDNILDAKESMIHLLGKLNFRESEPKFIDVDPISRMAANLTESILKCGAMEKDLHLYTLLHQPQYQQSRILIFTNSISSVRRLTTFLHNLNLPALPLHSQMPQKSRLRSLERFSAVSPSTSSSKASKQQLLNSILIATDVAARGLDIPTVNLIIHYHVPRAADAYVHRSGRTARAGASGASILLCSPEEVLPVQRLIVKIHHKTQRDDKAFRLDTISLPLDLLKRLKPRVQLSQQITACTMAKEKENPSSSSNKLLKQAAEDLGVEYDSDLMETEMTKGRGRGKGRRKREKEARDVSQQELGAMKTLLKEELGKRVHLGGSLRYPSAGDVARYMEGGMLG